MVDKKDWSLNGTFIFSMNRNKVLDLGSSVESGLLKDARTGMEYEVVGNLSEQYRSYTNILAIGQPINVFYGYKCDGIIQTLPEDLTQACREKMLCRENSNMSIRMMGTGHKVL